jgi:hypothetical protein
MTTGDDLLSHLRTTRALKTRGYDKREVEGMYPWERGLVIEEILSEKSEKTRPSEDDGGYAALMEEVRSSHGKR